MACIEASRISWATASAPVAAPTNGTATLASAKLTLPHWSSFAYAGRLKIFIVDIRGVDAFDKFDYTAQIPDHPDPYAEKLRPSIIGESRKALTATFGGDHGEHEYLTTFFR